MRLLVEPAMEMKMGQSPSSVLVQGFWVYGTPYRPGTLYTGVQHSYLPLHSGFLGLPSRPRLTQVGSHLFSKHEDKIALVEECFVSKPNFFELTYVGWLSHTSNMQ
jgi:hypothetical protein